MDARHLISTQMLVIRWSPHMENVPFARSSRWCVCAYGSYVRAIARTRTNLYCACSRWYDEWEQREWMASYVPIRKVSNTPFQITRSRSSWEFARRMLLVQIQWLDILVMSGVMMIWCIVPHVLFPLVPDDFKFSVLHLIADVKISHFHRSWRLSFHWSICYVRCCCVVTMYGGWRLGVA